MYRTRDVFVAGGMPTVTYRSRERLETSISRHLDYGQEILSISGPTKTGKTVLIHHVVEKVVGNGVYIYGGTVESFDDFLGFIIDESSSPTTYEQSVEDENSGGRDRTGRITGGFAALEQKDTSSTKQRITHKQIGSRSKIAAAQDALRSMGMALVVDDFHFIGEETQLQIIRFLKNLIFDGLPVILVSVPHRAYDAVRVEKEMTGRLKTLNVGFWDEDDLRGIAVKGFETLNLHDSGDLVVNKMINETFSSPHLMQQFCLGICMEHDVRQEAEQPIDLGEPADGWSTFFRRLASDSSRSDFARLAKGARQQTSRTTRQLRDGRLTDLYGVVLEAISDTGPRMSISYEELRSGILQAIQGDAPQRREVVRTLERMSRIAREGNRRRAGRRLGRRHEHILHIRSILRLLLALGIARSCRAEPIRAGVLWEYDECR